MLIFEYEVNSTIEKAKEVHYVTQLGAAFYCSFRGF